MFNYGSLNRMSWLEELKTEQISFVAFERNDLDGVKEFDAMSGAKLFINDNVQNPDKHVLNLGQVMGASAGALILAFSCRGLDACFTPGLEYIPYQSDLSFVQNVVQALEIPADRATQIRRSAAARSEEHDWSTRLAQVFYDHFERINKL